MPFQYEQYRSPFVGTIGDLLLRRGDVEAQRARAIADAQARAELASGQAWGGAIQNIGQTVAAIPQQIQQAKAQQQQEQIRGLQLQQAQVQNADLMQRQKGQQAMDAMLTGDQMPPDAAGPRQPSYLDEQGLFDIPKITASLNAGGMGHLAPELVKGAESINASILTHQESQRKAAQAQAVMIGDLADGALRMAAAGTPIPQAIDFVAQPALVTKSISPEDFAKVKAQIASLPEPQQIAALNTLRDRAAQISPTKTLAEGATEVDRYGRPIATGGNKPPTEAELALKAAEGDPNAAKAMGMLKPAPNRTTEMDDARYRDIQARVVQKQPVTPDEIAWAGAYEKQKTLGVDKSASAAAERQTAAIAQQTAQQKRAQDFQQLQAARAEVEKNANKPYLDAKTSADTLRDVVTAAQNGNKIAGSLQSLETTMAAIRAQGLNRINTTEIGVTANAGNLYDRIKGWLGKATEGQPVPADIQKDMLAFSDILEQAAYKKYLDAHKSITDLYGVTTMKPSLPPPVSSTPNGPAIGERRIVNGQIGEWDGKGWKAVK